MSVFLLPALSASGANEAAAQAVPVENAATSTPTEPTVPPNPCELAEKTTDQLATLKTETDDAPKTELKLRSDLLSATIGCAVLEIDTLSAALTNVSLNNGRERGLRTDFLADLAKAREHHLGVTTQTASAGTIEETRTVARALQAWRETHYAPLAWEATEFLALVKNRNLIVAADLRLAQIEKVVTPLRIIGTGDEISPLLDAARESLETADREQGIAEAALRHDPRISPEDILVHNRASLEALARTYQTFFNISVAIKKIVGR